MNLRKKFLQQSENLAIFKRKIKNGQNGTGPDLRLQTAKYTSQS